MTPRALKQADAEAERAERMLKIAQVARMANVSPRTVWNDIAKGALQVERKLIRCRHRVRVTVANARAYASLDHEQAQVDEISATTPARLSRSAAF